MGFRLLGERILLVRSLVSYQQFFVVGQYHSNTVFAFLFFFLVPQHAKDL